MNKKIGIVLSGGMAKGAYEIGALKSIMSYFKPEEIEAVSAASIGALNGYAFCSGRLEFATNMWKNLNDTKDSISIRSLLKSDYLNICIKEIAKHNLQCKSFYVPLFKSEGKETVYKDLCTVPPCQMEDYLRAAVAVFGLCKPYSIGHDEFYDGALIDNIPILPLENKNLDLIICIHFDDYNYVFDTVDNDAKIVKIVFGDHDNIIKNSIFFNKNEINRMIAVGEQKAKDMLDIIFANGFENKDVYAQIQKINRLHPKKQMRITADVAVNNFNKIIRRLTAKRPK